MWNQLKTILLLGALSAGLVAFGGALGEGYLYVFTALAALMNLGAYFFSDRIVLSMHRARPLEPHEAPGLHGIVEELAARAGIDKPRVYLIEDPHANAFATGRNPRHAAVAVTTGILEVLTPRELRGVLAHEIGHVVNRDILVSSVAATLAGAITSVANALQFGALFGWSQDDREEGGSPAGALLLAFVAPVAATLVQLGISRSREYLADETGARLSGDPEALARALEKIHLAAEHVPGHVQPATASLFIVNPLAGTQGLVQLFSTHPPIEERVRRLRAMAHGSALRVA
ncbi:MAG TPA: zinc metalloprotease HtpX [Vicinamibacteria bacterium]|nr:zinc metalloprotease HtpX [Vicinamibacteria bacterium]